MYRGALVETACEVNDCEADRFLRVSCDGTGFKVTITSALFALNYLFLGGRNPPCLEACDLNDDGLLVLSDSIYLLDFLFLGGPPPAWWTDSDGDGLVDPTCEAATAERCREPHAACE